MNDIDKKAIEHLDEAINKLTNRDVVLYFFVVDSKNVPNGNMQYVYQLARTLHKMKYNVKMIYQLENEYTQAEIDELKRKEKPIDERRVFTGVGEWMGQEYMEIPHMNISKEEWKVSPSDFLFIPEVFSSLMKQTYQYKAPCKRIVILHNYDYITEFIPFNDEWGTYGIHDVITNSQRQADLVKGVFPYVDCKVLSPYVADIFRKPIKPKKLIVNIVSKKTEDVNKIMKQFYWKYPMYKFVTFRDLRGYPKETFAEYLQESAITVWIDTETPFGYSAVEAIKTGNIVIGKVPEHIPEWMGDDSGMFDNGVWTYDINAIPDILSRVLGSWLQDKIPEVIYENMEKLDNLYTYEDYEKNVKNLIEHYINTRKEEFHQFRLQINNKNNE